MKPGALLTVVGALGLAGYFGYDYWKSEEAKKKGRADAATALAARNARNIDPTVADPSTRPVAIDMPDLAGLTPEDAKAALTKAGFKLDRFKVLTGSECAYKDEKDMKPKGRICSQEPAPKAKAVPNARVEVTVEEDDYREGGIGSPSAWLRMPAVEGLTESAAKAALRTAGFAEDEFDFEHEQGCGPTPGRVCRSNPDDLQRKVRGRQGTIIISD